MTNIFLFIYWLSPALTWKHLLARMIFNQLFKNSETLDEFLTCIMSVVVIWGLCQSIHSELSKVVSSSCPYYPLWSLNLYLQRTGHAVFQLSWWFQKMQWNLQNFTKMFKSAVMYKYMYMWMQYPLKQKQKVKDVSSSTKRDFLVPEIQEKTRVKGKLELQLHTCIWELLFLI